MRTPSKGATRHAWADRSQVCCSAGGRGEASVTRVASLPVALSASGPGLDLRSRDRSGIAPGSWGPVRARPRERHRFHQLRCRGRCARACAAQALDRGGARAPSRAQCDRCACVHSCATPRVHSTHLAPPESRTVANFRLAPRRPRRRAYRHPAFAGTAHGASRACDSPGRLRRAPSAAGRSRRW